jgi:hypothetical protein
MESLESLRFASAFRGHGSLFLPSLPRLNLPPKWLSISGSSDTDKVSTRQWPGFSEEKKSRGELFIEKALSGRRRSEGSGSRPPSKKERKEQREDYMTLYKRQGTGKAGCYGCGATLQTEEEEAPGYVPLDLYETVCVCPSTLYRAFYSIYSLSPSLSRSESGFLYSIAL